MFKNTIAALNNTKRKIKLASKIFSISVQVIYLAYLAFSIFSGLGNLWVNIALAATATAYIIFDLLTRDSTDKITQNRRKRISGIYRRGKLIYSLFPLLASVYAMYAASAADVKPIAIITTTIMIILWVVRAVIELAVYLVSKEIDVLKSAFLDDVESAKAAVTAPINAVGSFVKGVSGKAEDDDISGAAVFGRQIRSFFSRKRKAPDKNSGGEEKELSLSAKK